jgi:benzoyl-CoA reductase/2-hydroxyglutaryl-CoA dehydratase subunit BcrC/BadD/HgdB
VGQIKNAGYKVITIEREYTPVIDQQVVSRLETFREIL